MEVAKMILDYTLGALNSDDLVEAEITLRIAKKLIAALPPYYIEDALEALFGGETSAE